jgi:hypothetical protein
MIVSEFAESGSASHLNSTPVSNFQPNIIMGQWMSMIVVGTIAAVIFILACFGKRLRSKEKRIWEEKFHRQPEAPKEKKEMGAYGSTS